MIAADDLKKAQSELSEEELEALAGGWMAGCGPVPTSLCGASSC